MQLIDCGPTQSLYWLPFLLSTSEFDNAPERLAFGGGAAAAAGGGEAKRLSSRRRREEEEELEFVGRLRYVMSVSWMEGGCMVIRYCCDHLMFRV